MAEAETGHERQRRLPPSRRCHTRKEKSWAWPGPLYHWYNESAPMNDMVAFWEASFPLPYWRPVLGVAVGLCSQ